MYRISKLFQQLLCEEFGDRGNIRSGALVSLERWFVRSVKDEDGVDRERDQS
jgi:hypothetical protein